MIRLSDLMLKFEPDPPMSPELIKANLMLWASANKARRSKGKKRG